MKEQKGLFKKKIKINFIGRIWMFPKGVKDAIYEVMKSTKNYNKLTVNFAMAYGGRQEIVDSFSRIADKIKQGKLKPKNINESVVAKNLYLSREPELVIRPGGEIRTSNFLTWQSAYSEWVFVDKLWPEFTKQDFIDCVEEFNKRERRFGK